MGGARRGSDWIRRGSSHNLPTQLPLKNTVLGELNLESKNLQLSIQPRDDGEEDEVAQGACDKDIIAAARMKTAG